MKSIQLLLLLASCISTEAIFRGFRRGGGGGKGRRGGGGRSANCNSCNSALAAANANIADLQDQLADAQAAPPSGGGGGGALQGNAQVTVQDMCADNEWYVEFALHVPALYENFDNFGVYLGASWEVKYRALKLRLGLEGDMGLEYGSTSMAYGCVDPTTPVDIGFNHQWDAQTGVMTNSNYLDYSQCNGDSGVMSAGDYINLEAGVAIALRNQLDISFYPSISVFLKGGASQDFVTSAPTLSSHCSGSYPNAVESCTGCWVKYPNTAGIGFNSANCGGSVDMIYCGGESFPALNAIAGWDDDFLVDGNLNIPFIAGMYNQDTGGGGANRRLLQSGSGGSGGAILPGALPYDFDWAEINGCGGSCGSGEELSVSEAVTFLDNHYSGTDAIPTALRSSVVNYWGTYGSPDANGELKMNEAQWDAAVAAITYEGPGGNRRRRDLLQMQDPLS